MGPCVQATGDADGSLGRKEGATVDFKRGRRLLSDSEAEQGWGRTAPDARGAGKCSCPICLSAASALRSVLLHCSSDMCSLSDKLDRVLTLQQL